MFKKTDRGNVLFIILIAVVLFAALSYAVTTTMRDTGNNTKVEEELIDAAVVEQCIAYVEYGIDKLELLKGCDMSEINFELPDGSNENVNAPTDGSCDLFTAEGANLSPCAFYAEGNFPCLLDLEIGESCAGIIYAGMNNGSRLYTTPSNYSSKRPWSNGTNYQSTSANNNSDGAANTDLLINLTSHTDYPYRAARACRTLGPQWYLPAINETSNLFNHRALIGNLPDDDVYWSSTEAATHAAVIRRMTDGGTQSATKNGTQYVRCVRLD